MKKNRANVFYFDSKKRCICLFFTISLIMFTSVGYAQEPENSEEKKPITFDGSLTLTGTKYSVAGASRRRPPTSWTIVGTPTLGIYGVSLPFTFILSDQESEFRQPFDQIGVSPSYKWATLHLGFNSLTYSKYSLAGITFLGAGVDLNPEPLRLSVMYGRFQRAVEMDTAPATNTYSFIQPAYKRMGFAVKAGYGTDKGFIDFIYLHAKDDSTSLLRHPDSLYIFPEENTVYALNTHFQIIKQLSFDAEAAMSFFTRDIRASKLDSSSLPSSLSALADIKSSTNLLTAANAGLVFTIPHFTAKLGYERIEPDYNSLGAYYYTSDVENYTFAPSFDLFENKFRISGSVGIQHDNLLASKVSQTQRIIGSGNMSINPAQVFGLDINYTNYATEQGLGRPPDTGSLAAQFRVRSVSQSASVTPRLLFISTETMNMFILSVSQQQYTDKNILTDSATNSRTTTASLNYNLSYLKTGFTIGASLLYADTKQASTTVSLRGGTINASKSLMQNTMTIGASIGYTSSAIHQPLDYNTNTFNESLNSSYRISSQGTLSLSIYATENSSTLAGISPFTEILATLSYSHNFSF
jgi:hypothetical protein